MVHESRLGMPELSSREGRFAIGADRPVLRDLIVRRILASRVAGKIDRDSADIEGDRVDGSSAGEEERQREASDVPARESGKRLLHGPLRFGRFQAWAPKVRGFRGRRTGKIRVQHRLNSHRHLRGHVPYRYESAT